jgi:hypothetical protein
MTVEEHLLACLAEECAEISEQCSRVVVRVTKALRFGPDEVQPGQLLDNVQRIAAEVADLVGVFELLEEAGLVTRDQVEVKKRKVAAFMDYAGRIGALERPDLPGESRTGEAGA